MNIFCRVALLTALVFTAQTILLPASCWAFVVALQGDVDSDGDVDNTDLGTILGNIGLPGAFLEDGDVNSDMAVSREDFEIAKGNFGDASLTAAISTQSLGSSSAGLTVSSAELLYNPTDGHVFIDPTNAAGGFLTNFVLNSGGLFQTGIVNFPFPGDLKTDTSDEISQTHDDPFSLLVPITASSTSSLIDLGAILPTGLDASAFSGSYVGTPGSGVQVFATGIVPEPGSVMLAYFGLMLSCAARCKVR